MSFKIGSFNVRNLSDNSSKARDLDKIANMIRQFDIIVLQEALSGFQTFEASFGGRLGNRWDMAWVDAKSESNDSRGEGYLFIWRKDKFKCPKDKKGEDIKPCTIENYHINEFEKKLARAPGYGRFQHVYMSNLEIRLITTHIIFSKQAGVSEEGAISLRKKEFEVLARSIYTSINDKHDDIDCKVPYTILLGDYNLNLKESGAGLPYVFEITLIDKNKKFLGGYETINKYESLAGDLKRRAVYKLHTVQTDKTTINTDGKELASNYDHFTYDEHTERVVKGRAHSLNIIKADLGKYKEEVSDHIPVMVELDFG